MSSGGIGMIGCGSMGRAIAKRLAAVDLSCSPEI